MPFTKPKPLAWFFFLAAFATTLALGTWQVQRLAWKEGLIKEISDAAKAAPLGELPSAPDALKAIEFHHVLLDGAWLGTHEFHVAARYFKGQIGYQVFTPFQLADGRVVMVNRGWVPAAKKDIKTRPETAVGEEDQIVGLVRYGADRNYFTPPSQPEKNIWFGRDVAQMGEVAGLKNVVPEVSIDRIGTQDATRLPVPSDGNIALRNDHLSYVLTWYGIALGILVIFVLSHRKKA